MDSLGSSIDEHLEKYFDILDTIIELRTQLDNFLKEGYFNLSKARYSMGVNSVGQLQYDTSKMKPLVHVVSLENSDFEIQRDLLQKTHRPISSQPKKKQGTASQLRQRKPREKLEKNASSDDEEVEKEEGEEEVSRGLEEMDISGGDEAGVIDPLRWFGVLVPSVLKQGQASFIKAVDISCRLANLQRQLEGARQEYTKLMKEKVDKEPTTTSLPTQSI